MLIMDKLQSISGLTQYKFISITHKTQLSRELTTVYLKHSGAGANEVSANVKMVSEAFLGAAIQRVEY